MTTMRDIAKRAGVSVATVSYVLNNTRYVSEERKKAVLKAVDELNYVPNAMARSLRVRETRSLGLILSDITNPFYPELAKACEDAAKEFGYSIIMMNTDDQEDKTISALSQIREGKVDGLIVSSCLMDERHLLDDLITEGYPIVLAHRRIPELNVDTVICDNFSGAYAVTRHLISLGHRHIVMMKGTDKASVIADRIQGFKSAMKDFGLQIHPDWIQTGGLNYQHGYTAAMSLLQMPERPTAIMASCDIAAIGVLDAVKDLGMEVPRDLAVVGCDDLFLSATTQLTTIRIPRYDIGYHATKILIDRINQTGPPRPVEMVLPTQLVVRSTCGAGKMGRIQDSTRLKEGNKVLFNRLK